MLRKTLSKVYYYILKFLDTWFSTMINFKHNLTVIHNFKLIKLILCKYKVSHVIEIEQQKMQD